MTNTRNELTHKIARIARKVPMLVTLKQKLFPSKIPEFTNSEDYWKSRYEAGGNSGEGSYGLLADYKADFLNAFVDKHDLKTVFELGCGDGNQLSKLKFPQYVGVDISTHCLEVCQKTADERGYEFMTPDSFDTQYDDQSIELGLSLDVIYHLIEDEIYHDYMKCIFRASSKFVIVYASDFDEYDMSIAHVRHRNFTKYVAENYKEWSLIESHENPFQKDHKSTEYGSFAKFFVFQRS